MGLKGKLSDATYKKPAQEYLGWRDASRQHYCRAQNLGPRAAPHPGNCASRVTVTAAENSPVVQMVKYLDSISWVLLLVKLAEK